MNSVSVIEIVNPYEWLPSYGENNITYRNRGKDFILEILFDSDGEETTKTISFKGTVWSSVSMFPGANNDTMSYPIYKNIECLVELNDSIIARNWNDFFKHMKKLCHFQIYFLAANKRVEIVCERMEVS